VSKPPGVVDQVIPLNEHTCGRFDSETISLLTIWTRLNDVLARILRSRSVENTQVIGAEVIVGSLGSRVLSSLCGQEGCPLISSASGLSSRCDARGRSTASLRLKFEIGHTSGSQGVFGDAFMTSTNRQLLHGHPNDARQMSSFGDTQIGDNTRNVSFFSKDQPTWSGPHSICGRYTVCWATSRPFDNRSATLPESGNIIAEVRVAAKSAARTADGPGDGNSSPILDEHTHRMFPPSIVAME